MISPAAVANPVATCGVCYSTFFVEGPHEEEGYLICSLDNCEEIPICPECAPNHLFGYHSE